MTKLFFFLFIFLSYTDAQILSVLKWYPELSGLQTDYDKIKKSKKPSGIKLSNFLKKPGVTERLYKDIENLKYYFSFPENQDVIEDLENLEEKIKSRKFTAFDYQFISRLMTEYYSLEAIIAEYLKITLRNKREVSPELKGKNFSNFKLEDLRGHNLIDFLKKEVKKNKSKDIWYPEKMNGDILFLRDEEKDEAFAAKTPSSGDLYWKIKKEGILNEEHYYAAHWYTLDSLSIKDITELTLEGIIPYGQSTRIVSADGEWTLAPGFLFHDELHGRDLLDPQGNLYVLKEYSAGERRRVLKERLSHFKEMYIRDEKKVSKENFLSKVAFELFWFRFLREQSTSFFDLQKNKTYVLTDESLKSSLSDVTELAYKKSIGISGSDEGQFSQSEVKTLIKKVGVYGRKVKKEISQLVCNMHLR